jgi:hypothetical protein
VKEYAIGRHKIHARSSKRTFDQGNRVMVSRVATHPDSRDPSSMKTGRLATNSQLLVGWSIRICAPPRSAKVCPVTCDEATIIIAISPIKEGSSEPHII